MNRFVKKKKKKKKNHPWSKFSADFSQPNQICPYHWIIPHFETSVAHFKLDNLSNLFHLVAMEITFYVVFMQNVT